MNFSDWIAQKVGTRHWVVAPRLTDRLASKGFEFAISQKKFSALKDEWICKVHICVAA